MTTLQHFVDAAIAAARAGEYRRAARVLEACAAIAEEIAAAHAERLKLGREQARELRGLVVNTPIGDDDATPSSSSPPAPIAATSSSAAPPRRVRPGRGNGLDRHELHRLHDLGMSDEELAAALGAALGTVSNARRKLGLRPHIKRAARPAPASSPAPSSSAASSPAPSTPSSSNADELVERISSAATLVNFLKGRGVILSDLGAGRWKINGRDVVDRDGLMRIANNKRAMTKGRPFAWERP